MENLSFSFDQLPKEVARLHSRLDSIENKLQHITDGGLPNVTGDLLTVPQAAELLSLSIPTIYGLLHRRQLPAMKRGKRVYFKRSELLLYLEDGRKTTVEDLERNGGTRKFTKIKGGKR